MIINYSCNFHTLSLTVNMIAFKGFMIVDDSIWQNLVVRLHNCKQTIGLHWDKKFHWHLKFLSSSGLRSLPGDDRNELVQCILQNFDGFFGHFIIFAISVWAHFWQNCMLMKNYYSLPSAHSNSKTIIVHVQMLVIVKTIINHHDCLNGALNIRNSKEVLSSLSYIHVI